MSDTDDTGSNEVKEEGLVEASSRRQKDNSAKSGSAKGALLAVLVFSLSFTGAIGITYLFTNQQETQRIEQATEKTAVNRYCGLNGELASCDGLHDYIVYDFRHGGYDFGIDPVADPDAFCTAWFAYNSPDGRGLAGQEGLTQGAADEVEGSLLCEVTFSEPSVTLRPVTLQLDPILDPVTNEMFEMDNAVPVPEGWMPEPLTQD